MNRLAMPALVVVVMLIALPASAAQKRIVTLPGAKPGGNFSQGVLIDGTLYVSGQAGEDKDGKIAATFEAEMKQALDNIDAVLKAAAMTPADVVSVQAYLTDETLFPRFNAVYTSYFTEPRPTRTTVVVKRLVGEGHVEITVTARK